MLIGKSVSFSLTNIISDKDGRYLIISATLSHVPVLLVNVQYTPQILTSFPSFMNKLFENLLSLNKFFFIFGGDINCVGDPQLDCSKPGSTKSLMAMVLHNFMSSNGCVDPWRLHNSSSRQYFFFHMCTKPFHA